MLTIQPSAANAKSDSNEPGPLCPRWLLGGALALSLSACASLPGLSGIRNEQQSAVARSEASLAKVQEADALYARMQWSEAQAAYSTLAQEFPRNAYLWFRLGNCQTRLNQLEPAAQSYQNALSIEPQDGRYSYNLGLVRMAQARMAFEHAQHRLATNDSIRRDAQEQVQRVEAALAPSTVGRP